MYKEYFTITLSVAGSVFAVQKQQFWGFSGGSRGFVVGHVAPEAQVGGPIAYLQTGDIVTIDSQTQEISFQITEEELNRRQDHWIQPKLKASSGALGKYARLVSPASKGAVTDMFES